MLKYVHILVFGHYIINFWQYKLAHRKDERGNIVKETFISRNLLKEYVLRNKTKVELLLLNFFNKMW